MTNVAPEKIAALPEWLGELRNDGLRDGERLIRIEFGALAGQLAIVCLGDGSPDPDSSEAPRELVYTQEDWEAECAPSLGFDDDGDLVWFAADGGFCAESVAHHAIEVAS